MALYDLVVLFPSKQTFIKIETLENIPGEEEK